MAVGTGPKSTRSGSRKKGATGAVPSAARGGAVIGNGGEDPTGLEPAPMAPPVVNPLKNKQVSNAVRTVFRKIKEAKERRAEVNAEIKALRESLVARGLNKGALDDLERYWKKDENQRDGYDMTWDAGREALGLPIQASFELPPPETSETPTPGKEAGAAAGKFKPKGDETAEPKETAEDTPEAVH